MEYTDDIEDPATLLEDAIDYGSSHASLWPTDAVSALQQGMVQTQLDWKQVLAKAEQVTESSADLTMYGGMFRTAMEMVNG